MHFVLLLCHHYLLLSISKRYRALLQLCAKYIIIIIIVIIIIIIIMMMMMIIIIIIIIIIKINVIHIWRICNKGVRGALYVFWPKQHKSSKKQIDILVKAYIHIITYIKVSMLLLFCPTCTRLKQTWFIELNRNMMLWITALLHPCSRKPNSVIIISRGEILYITTAHTCRNN